MCFSRQHCVTRKKGTKFGEIQRYYCKTKTCGKWFVFTLGFERMKANPQAITASMQLYFSGESLRNVQKFLKLQGMNVTHVAVYKWIEKYVKLMEAYLEQMQPQGKATLGELTNYS